MAILIGVIIGLSILLVLAVMFSADLLKEINETKKITDSALAQLRNMQQDYDNFQSSRKSSETRLGLITEQLAPMLDAFPVKGTQDIHFFGQPVDYIAFNEDGVHFIEIKSGNAKLSPKQIRIRDQVLAGKVFWHVMRVK